MTHNIPPPHDPRLPLPNAAEKDWTTFLIEVYSNLPESACYPWIKCISTNKQLFDFKFSVEDPTDPLKRYIATIGTERAKTGLESYLAWCMSESEIVYLDPLLWDAPRLDALLQITLYGNIYFTIPSELTDKKN